MKNNKQQLGFSLIELMVGMVIGLLVSAIIITVFTQSKRSYNEDEEVSQLQENGRYALQLLTREHTMAGFAGPIYIVGDITTGITLPNNCGLTNWSKVNEEPILLLPEATATLPSCISGVKENTDVVVIKGVVGGSTTTQSANKLYLRTSGTGGSIIAGAAGASAVLPNTDWEYTVRIYYIKDKVVDGETIPTLRKAQLLGNLTWDDEELVQGIENFKITFRIDTDTNADDIVDSYTYKTSPTAAELTQASLAKIDVLVRSINKDYRYTNDRTYYSGGTEIDNTLDDAHYYGRVFSSTAPMRNISYRSNL